jgi:hypothetical protein
MENRGDGRVVFTLRRLPPRTRRSTRGGRLAEVPVFEPFQESLPLQSGIYSFLIDKDGHFRVRRGNIQSHSAMVPDRVAAIAGRFQVNRAGRVVEVVCQSTDFWQFIDGPADALVRYTIESFASNEALNLNPEAVFAFFRRRYDSWHISASGKLVTDPQTHLRLLLEEGVGAEISRPFSLAQAEAFQGYTPPLPPSLHSMHRDQLITSIEEGGDSDVFEIGPPAQPLGPSSDPIRVGKNNFVINEKGQLIVGASGHHLLSGGGRVGGAGHIHFESDWLISRLELNFSGHYRPPLTGNYVRYVFAVVAGHPLLTLSPDCQFAGRVFKDCDAISRVLTFARGELEFEELEIDRYLETLQF